MAEAAEVAVTTNGESLVGASLSEPHTRELNEKKCLCVCQCARTYVLVLL